MSEESRATTYRLPILDGRNYVLWKKQMVLVLQCKKLAKCLSEPLVTVKTDGTTEVTKGYTDSEDQECLAFISGYISFEVQLKVASCTTSWDTWDRLQQIYENKNPSNVGKIFEQYHVYKKEPSDDMATHIGKVETLALQLGLVGEPQSEISVMAKLLYSLPEEYDTLKSAWESVHPSLQNRRNLTARLLAFDNMRSSEVRSTSKEVALMVKKSYKESGYNAGNDKKKRVKCYNCGKLGHYKRECRSKPAEGRNSGSSVALVVSSGERSDKWVIDSGASHHTCCRRDWFRTFRSTNEKLQVGNEDWVEAVGRGNIHISCDVGGGRQEKVILKDVLYIPKMSYNLFSTIEAANKGATVTMNSRGCKITYQGRTVALGKFDDSIGVCTLNGKTEAGILMMVSTRRTLDDWHRALGHVDPQVISDMVNNKVVDGMELMKDTNSGCGECAAGKGTRAPHTTPSSHIASQVGEQVDMDLVSVSSESMGKNKYIIIAIDKFSSYTWVCPIKSKDEVCRQLQGYIGQFEALSGKRIRCIQTDKGSEFNNKNVHALLGVEHIELRFSSEYTPQQNGLAERNNRYIIEGIRTMMLQSGLPLELWAEAAVTAAYLRNRVPRRGAKVTPYELFISRKPFVGHLVAFGTPVQSLINDRRIGKFDPKTQPGFIVGFTERANTYRVYLPSENRVKQTCDVIFRQHVGCLDGSKVVGAPAFNKEYETLTATAQVVKSKRRAIDEFFDDIQRQIGQHNVTSDSLNDTSHGNNEQVNAQPSPEPTAPVGLVDESSGVVDPAQQNVENVLPDREPAEDLPEIESSSFSTITNYSPNREDMPGGRYSVEEAPTQSPFQGRSIPRSPPRGARPTILLSCAPTDSEARVPETWTEALTGTNKSNWKLAIESELKAHIKNKTWQIVKRPGHGALLDTKWVFALKKDSAGNIEKFKARLVAKGFQQREGLNYDETFSPVARRESIRVLLAIAAARKMSIERFDVSTAFLNGKLKDDVFINPPLGFPVPDGMCLKLEKALYGLKQAPRVWSSLFDEVMVSLAYKATTSDPCVYFNERTKCFVSIYVDDGLIIGPTKEECIKLIEALNNHFQTKRITSDVFLGMQIVQTSDGYHLNQSRYASELITALKLEESKVCSSPMVDRKILFHKGDDEIVEGDYAAWIGSLQYLAHTTRPDILYATSVLARFTKAPKKVHWTAVRQVMKYVNSTRDIGLMFRGPTQHVEIAAYADADWAGDEEERKSTSGVIITVCGSPVIFGSRLQSLVAQSSTEAEFVAACDAAKEISWLTGLLEELKIEFQQPRLFIDNKSTIHIIRNNDVKRRSRHIELRFFYVRQKFKEGKFELEYIPTSNQLADFLTKALGAKPMADLITRANVIRLPD